MTQGWASFHRAALKAKDIAFNKPELAKTQIEKLSILCKALG